ncbi:hypothetical protein pb186bvf_004923 [Paramecium bursaria]
MEIKVLSIYSPNIEKSLFKNQSNIQYIEDVQFISDINRLQFQMNDNKIIIIKLPQEIMIQLNQLDQLKKQQQESDILITKMNAQIEQLKNQLYNSILQQHEIEIMEQRFSNQIQDKNSQIDNQIERYVLELSSRIQQNESKNFFLKIKDLINSFKIDEIS